MELISRQAAIDALEKWLHGLFGITEADGTATIFKTIRQLPPIPPAEPKRGRWIHDGSKWKNRWVCSECGYKWFFDCIEGAYCPNCGCRMNGDE